MCLVSLGSLASCGSKDTGSTGSGNTAKPTGTDTVKPDPEPAKKEKLVLSGAEDQKTFVLGKANAYLKDKKLDRKYE